jgi:predicted dehydrogenase
MSKLKIGIIGCGGIANQKHFPALTLQKDMLLICNSTTADNSNF